MPVSTLSLAARSRHLQVLISEFQTGRRPRSPRVDLAAVPESRAFGNRSQFPQVEPRRRVGLGQWEDGGGAGERGEAHELWAPRRRLHSRPSLSHLPTTAGRDLRYVLR